MNKFLCEAEVNGKLQRTVINAESIEQARELLTNRGWQVISITPLVVR